MKQSTTGLLDWLVLVFLLGAQSDRPVSSFFDYGALHFINAPYWTLIMVRYISLTHPTGPVSSFFDYGALHFINAPYWTDTGLFQLK
ncbi:MAG: hypothetical protein F6K17_12675 [Okeania sp. SIO3C4]|nr:hypothetical protein [Okeania sp. SIO3B3]NER03400.1 hypothetical protein [Okeania sp. SIO3C4]